MAVLQFVQTGVDANNRAVYNVQELKRFIPGWVNIQERARYANFTQANERSNPIDVEFTLTVESGQQWRFGLNCWFILDTKNNIKVVGDVSFHKYYGTKRRKSKKTYLTEKIVLLQKNLSFYLEQDIRDNAQIAKLQEQVARRKDLTDNVRKKLDKFMRQL